jgi:tetratricopeptide (TPR) repeat protein
MMSPIEIENINRLLLSADAPNVWLGLELAKAQAQNSLPIAVFYPLNMLAILHQDADIQAEADSLLANICQAEQYQTLQKKHLQIFLIAYLEPQKAWKQAYAAYEKIRTQYELLFLSHPRWQRWYRELIKLLYQHNQVELVVEYCNLLLAIQPKDFVIGSYKFQSVSALLESGKGREELAFQESWLQNCLNIYPKSVCRFQCLLGQFYSTYLQDKQKARAAYRAAIQAYEQSHQLSEFAAISYNNLACLDIEANLPLHQAYEYAQAAHELVSDNDCYLETLAYLEWKQALQPANARRLFLKTLRLNPYNLAAYSHLGQLEQAAGNLGQAQSFYQKLLEHSYNPVYKKYVIQGLEKFIGMLNSSSPTPATDEILSKIQQKLQTL